MSDARGAIYNKEGLDIPALLEHQEAHGSIHLSSLAEPIEQDELLCLECDFLIPAALGGVIHKMNAECLRCKVVIEGANGPTTPTADEVLWKKNIPVIPDILANAGGVIVSYYEWVQNLQRHYWEDGEVTRKLERKLVDSFYETAALAHSRKELSYRTAAFMLSIKRVAEAIEMRGRIT